MFVFFGIVLFYGGGVIAAADTNPKHFFCYCLVYQLPAIPQAYIRPEVDTGQEEGWVLPNPDGLQVQWIPAKRESSLHWSRRSWFFAFVFFPCFVLCRRRAVGRWLARTHAQEDKGINKGINRGTNGGMNKTKNHGTNKHIGGQDINLSRFQMLNKAKFCAQFISTHSPGSVSKVSGEKNDQNLVYQLTFFYVFFPEGPFFIDKIGNVHYLFSKKRARARSAVHW